MPKPPFLSLFCNSPPTHSSHSVQAILYHGVTQMDTVIGGVLTNQLECALRRQTVGSFADREANKGLRTADASDGAHFALEENAQLV